MLCYNNHRDNGELSVSSRRQTGAAGGAAVTGAIIPAGPARFVHPTHAAWAADAGRGVLAMLLGMFSTERWTLAPAEQEGA